PRLHHLGERRRAHRRAEREQLLDLGEQRDALRAVEEVALLLPCEMSDGPPDRVHLTAVFSAVRFADAAETAQPFASGEAKLLDDGMRHELSRSCPLTVATA